MKPLHCSNILITSGLYLSFWIVWELLLAEHREQEILICTHISTEPDWAAFLF